MKISKFLSFTVLITAFSLLYVYQQTEIFRCAYIGHKKQTGMQELLDKNSILRYNIQRNASLVQIGNKVSKSADYVMPDSYRLVRVSSSNQGLYANKNLPAKETLLSRIFSVRNQAEARTINP